MPTQIEILEDPPRAGFSPWRAALVYAAMLCLLVAMQYRSGAFKADLAGDNDEPAHVTTSLMVRDYLVQGLPHNPLAFARDF